MSILLEQASSFIAWFLCLMVRTKDAPVFVLGNPLFVLKPPPLQKLLLLLKHSPSDTNTTGGVLRRGVWYISGGFLVLLGTFLVLFTGGMLWVFF